MTRDFKETVRQRANNDPEFRNGLLKEALDAIDCGDGDVAKALIRDCIWENWIGVNNALKEHTDE